MDFLDFFRGQRGEPIPTGSDAAACSYHCTECGYGIKVRSVKSLPPSPKCNNNSWDAVTGGDAAADPGA